MRHKQRRADFILTRVPVSLLMPLPSLGRLPLALPKVPRPRRSTLAPTVETFLCLRIKLRVENRTFDKATLHRRARSKTQLISAMSSNV